MFDVLDMCRSVVFFDLFKLRDAIWYARDNGAHIISTSLGTPVIGATAWFWKRAVMDAIEANIILVTAGGQLTAGNLPLAEVILPASYHNVITLGAVNKTRITGVKVFGVKILPFPQLARMCVFHKKGRAVMHPVQEVALPSPRLSPPGPPHCGSLITGAIISFPSPKEEESTSRICSARRWKCLCRNRMAGMKIHKERALWMHKLCSC